MKPSNEEPGMMPGQAPNGSSFRAQTALAYDDPDVKAELIALFEAGERAKPEPAFGDLDRRRIFFYPGSGHDFTPLTRLTHLYDTFLYADYGIDTPELPELAAAIEDAVPGRTGLKVAEIKPLPGELLETLSRDPIHAASPTRHRGWERVPWGVQVRMTRTIGTVQRPIDLFYLCLEGVTLYRNLFVKTCTAPRGVCFISTDGFACNHTHFGRWSECFGAIVRQNPRKPEFVYHAHGDYDWPWNSAWQAHPDWKCLHGGTPIAYSLPFAREADPEAAPLVARPLEPARPPAGLQIVVRRGFRRPPGIYEIYRSDAVPSLAPGLKEEVERARASQVTELHYRLTGFEDEGCVLQSMQGTGDTALSLYLYCDTDGDVASLAPYCSRVENR